MYFLTIHGVEGETISYIERVKDMAFTYAPKLLGAIVFYMVGAWLIGRLTNVVRKILLKREHDLSLQTFLVSLTRISLNILLLVSVAGMIGIDTTAFGALLVGAGVAIGSALNGTLGNFAGGVMMLVFKPFKVGDYIQAQGTMGVVKEQGVFNTSILTDDYKTVYIPNGPLSTGIITNHTAHGFVRVEIDINVITSMDIDVVRRVTIDALNSHPKVLKEPAIEVNVLKTGDAAITIGIRPYAKQPDAGIVFSEGQELIKKAWSANGILTTPAAAPTQIVIQKMKADI